MGILATIEKDLKLVWQLFSDIVYAVFKAEESVLMVDATNIFKAEAIAIQNAQPGMPAKEFIALLISTATPLLVGDLAGLEYTAISTIASVVAHDLGVLTNGGNAGNVNG